MIRYLLDTDSLSLYQAGHLTVVRNVDTRPRAEIAVPIITVREQLGGRLARLAKARSPAEIETASRQLADTVVSLAGFPIAPMAAAAELRFRQLLQLRLNVGGNDLRIAAIALDSGATVVTRNRRDFGRVPNLLVEDWSV